MGVKGRGKRMMKRKKGVEGGRKRVMEVGGWRIGERKVVEGGR